MAVAASSRVISLSQYLVDVPPQLSESLCPVLWSWCSPRRLSRGPSHLLDTSVEGRDRRYVTDYGVTLSGMQLQVVPSENASVLQARKEYNYSNRQEGYKRTERWV